MKSIDMISGDIVEFEPKYESTPIPLHDASYTINIVDGEEVFNFFLEMNNFMEKIEVDVFRKGLRSNNIYLSNGIYHYTINEEKALAFEFISPKEIYAYRIDL